MVAMQLLRHKHIYDVRIVTVHNQMAYAKRDGRYRVHQFMGRINGWSPCIIAAQSGIVFMLEHALSSTTTVHTKYSDILFSHPPYITPPDTNIDETVWALSEYTAMGPHLNTDPSAKQTLSLVRQWVFNNPVPLHAQKGDRTWIRPPNAHVISQIAREVRIVTLGEIRLVPTMSKQVISDTADKYAKLFKSDD
jgi:hypothetical protein